MNLTIPQVSFGTSISATSLQCRVYDENDVEISQPIMCDMMVFDTNSFSLFARTFLPADPILFGIGG